MLKALSGPASTYQPSKRSNSWLKIKRCAHAPFRNPFNRSLAAVVLAAEQMLQDQHAALLRWGVSAVWSAHHMTAPEWPVEVIQGRPGHAGTTARSCATPWTWS
jgi:hypothetical protein